MSILGEDEDFLADGVVQRGDPAPQPNEDLQRTIVEIRRKQEPFLKLSGQLHSLFWELPGMSDRDFDKRLQPIWESFMEAAGMVGLSSYDIPQLKECCGKRRTWPDQGLGARYLRLGDAVRWVTSNIFRIRKPCEACERRRETLNRLIRIGRT